jgi:hypothetical protein
MLTDKETDTMNLIVAFRNSAEVVKNFLQVTTR